MKLIVGLGNPGQEYSKTRHNVGFEAIDIFCKENNISLSKENFGGVFSVENIDGEKVIIAKPLTFMNLSGDFVQKISHFYKIMPKDILVVYDDMDIELSKIRIKNNGSAGGQNGVKDIINKLASESFVRIRIGIGNKQNKDAVKHVLGKFNKEELPLINKALLLTTKVMKEFVSNDASTLMNKYNGN